MAESKDWDTTENLYIEGDNLDVLKLQFVPFLVVSLVSTPLVYAATA